LDAADKNFLPSNDGYHKQALSPSQTGASGSPESSLNGIDLGPPIATLRSLRALAEEDTVYDGANSKTQTNCRDEFDPTLQGLLSSDDVQRAIDMYDFHQYLENNPTH
jgi:hypothetical protein